MIEICVQPKKVQEETIKNKILKDKLKRRRETLKKNLNLKKNKLGNFQQNKKGLLMASLNIN
jgi:hypothetical protein